MAAHPPGAPDTSVEKEREERERAAEAIDPDPDEFKIGGETLEEFFHPSRAKLKISRGQMARLLTLYASKPAVHEAMKVLEFELRRSMRPLLREMIEAERAEMAAEERTEGGIILPKGQ